MVSTTLLLLVGSSILSFIAFIYLSATEFKYIDGYSELNVSSVLWSIFISCIPIANVLVACIFAIKVYLDSDLGNKIVWTNKK